MRNTGRNHALTETGHAFREEVAQALARKLHAERGVEICAAEIEVDRDDMIAETRKRDRDIGRKQALADAALAAADCPHLLHARRTAAGGSGFFVVRFKGIHSIFIECIVFRGVV